MSLAEALARPDRRIDLIVIKPIRSLQAALHRGPARSKPIALAVVPA